MCIRDRPYGPVFGQLHSIWKAVNRSRRKRGFEPLAFACLRNKLKLGKVFVERRRPKTQGSDDAETHSGVSQLLHPPRQLDRRIPANHFRKTVLAPEQEVEEHGTNGQPP